MTTKTLLAVAALATAFSATARAGEADYSDNLQQFNSQRARAEVKADAVQAARTYSFETAGSGVSAPVQSDLTRQEIRADVAQALRQGRIASGEASI